MDKTQQYIQQCETAREIQYNKYANGFEEGDYVFDGKIVRIVGHDFLNIQSKHDTTPLNIFNFYMVEPCELNTIYNEALPREIQMRTEKYVSEYISNPTWLPRQDQLQDMAGTLSKYHVHLTASFLRWCETYSKNPIFSMEQRWFGYIMFTQHNKKWNGTEWKSLCE